jgi:hypothetical protein
MASCFPIRFSKSFRVPALRPVVCHGPAIKRHRKKRNIKNFSELVDFIMTAFILSNKTLWARSEINGYAELINPCYELRVTSDVMNFISI